MVAKNTRKVLIIASLTLTAVKLDVERTDDVLEFELYAFRLVDDDDLVGGKL